MSKRILLAGSRRWPSTIRSSWLNHVAAASSEDRLIGDMIVHSVMSLRIESEQDVLVHGDCPTGLDRIIMEIWGPMCEPHPADWALHGRAAGPIRNTEMVRLGADVCEVFLYGRSRGTVNLLEQAKRAGIECWANSFENGRLQIRSENDIGIVRLAHT